MGSLHLSGVTHTESISVERGNVSDVDTSKALWEPRDLIRGDALTGRILNTGPEAASGWEGAVSAWRAETGSFQPQDLIFSAILDDVVHDFFFPPCFRVGSVSV